MVKDSASTVDREVPPPPRGVGACLIETRPKGWAFYSPFDKGLGYWTSDFKGVKKSRKTPTWPILDARGRPFSVQRFKGGDLPESTLLHYSPVNPEFIGELERFLLEIPERVRRLAVLCEGRHQWLALEGMACSSDFMDFLEQEANASGGLAFVSAGWSLSKAHRLSLTRRRQLIQSMMASKRTALLTEWVGRPCNKAFLRAMRKIRGEQSAGALECLAELMEYPQKRQAIAETDALLADQLGMFAALPSPLASPAMLEVLREAASQGFRRIESIIPPSVMHAAGPVLDRVAHSFRSVRNLRDLEERVRKWTVRIKTEVVFPPPLLGKGSSFLKALPDGQALEREARRMRNCLPGYAPRCAQGETSFYVFYGQERASVQVSRLHGEILYIEEALGHANARLANSTLIELFREVAALPSSLNVVLFTFPVVGLAYYEAHSVKSRLRAGSGLRLLPEPTNEFDGNAIQVVTLDGDNKLGYIPRNGLPKQVVNQFKKEGADLLAAICTLRETPDLQIEVAVSASLKQRSLFQDEEIPVRSLGGRAPREEVRRANRRLERHWAGRGSMALWGRPGMEGNLLFGEEVTRQRRAWARARVRPENEREGLEGDDLFCGDADRGGEREFDDDIPF